MSDERLTKIFIDLPNHWAIGGEALWAEPLGNDLYKIENIPFYAYGLNYHDIVRTNSQSAELKPEIKELVKASGHKTFRVFFKEGFSRDQQEKYLDQLNKLDASYERANDIYFSIDLKPNGDYQKVFDLLDEFERNNVLEFETCEAKIEGSFDDLPEK